MDVTCSVEGCARVAQRKGWCSAHYQQQYRYGTTSLVGPQPKPCQACGKIFQPEYNRVVYCSDLCRRGEGTCVTCGKTFLIKKGASGKYCSRDCWYDSAEDRMAPCPICQTPFKSSAKTCSAKCGREYFRRNRPEQQRYCAQCGTLLVGKKKNTSYCSRSCFMYARGGLDRDNLERRMTDHGYIDVRVNGHWVAEHRYLMEQLLGRPLHRLETVHHINGDRSDNTVTDELVKFRSGNLELWSSVQPSGQRVADKVEYAVELLRLYRPDLLAT
jgi:hypothetical protein